MAFKQYSFVISLFFGGIWGLTLYLVAQMVKDY